MNFLTLIDQLSELFAWVAKVMLLVLVCSMIYEVCARYIFDSPTLWAFDISYMLNGTIFLLGAGFTLKADAHVRIDFLSTRLALKHQQWINAFFYLFILFPIFIVFAYISTTKSINAFNTAEVESVSPWAPLVWPFYSAIATGLWVLAFQFLADGYRYLKGLKTPGEHNGEMINTEENL